jgi:hypothetical protein
MMSRKVWIAFIVVQLLGLICVCAWEYDIFGTGAAMWATSVFVLLPGDLISALIVEKLLWNSGLTVTQMAFVEIPLEVAVNLCVWLLCVKIIHVIKRIAKRRSGVSEH